MQIPMFGGFPELWEGMQNFYNVQQDAQAEVHQGQQQNALSSVGLDSGGLDYSGGQNPFAQAAQQIGMNPQSSQATALRAGPVASGGAANG